MNKNTFWGIIFFILIAIALISLRQSVNFQSDGYHDELARRQAYQADDNFNHRSVSSDMTTFSIDGPRDVLNSDNNVVQEEEIAFE